MSDILSSPLGPVQLPNQVSHVYDWLVCFQVRSVASLSGGGVLVLKQDRMGNFIKTGQLQCRIRQEVQLTSCRDP